MRTPKKNKITDNENFSVDIQKISHSIFHNPSVKAYNRWRNNTVMTVSIILGLLGIGSFIVMLSPTLANWHDKLLAKLSLLICGIFPAIWFWCEYIYIWWSSPKDCRPDFDEFKYGQEVGRRIWLGFFSVILILYFKLP